MADPNVFEDAVARVERIGEAAGVGGEVVDALRQPKAVLTADLPVRMDDGSTRHFLAYRCRSCCCTGPPSMRWAGRLDARAAPARRPILHPTARWRLRLGPLTHAPRRARAM